AVSAVSEVKFVDSKSRQGLSTVRLWMNWGADVNNGQTEVIQRIQQILSSLPTGIRQPFVLRFDLSNIPVCLVTASGGGLDEKQLYDLAYNTIEPQLERLGGVASASVDGGKVRQITVNLNRDQLFAKGLSVLDVVRAVNDSNFLLPAGDIKVGRLDYNIYTNNQFRLVQPMEDIVVRKTGAGGGAIHVEDLGYVVDSHETQTAIVRIDGARGVFMRVNKQPGANTVAVVDQVRALIPQVIGVPPGVNVGITFDQSTYIRQAIESLWHEALQGSALAFLVILIFLRSLTSTLILSLAIPLSILLSFIVMYFLGPTLNVFPLGGLALAVGRLVPHSIVGPEPGRGPAAQRLGAGPPPHRRRRDRLHLRGEPLPRLGAPLRVQAAHRDGVLPPVGRGAVPDQRQGVHRHADRGDRADRQRHGVDRPGDRAPRSAENDRRQRRHPAGPLGRLHEQHGAPQRDRPGLPDDGGQARAERPRDRERDPAEVHRAVPRHALPVRLRRARLARHQ